MKLDFLDKFIDNDGRKSFLLSITITLIVLLVVILIGSDITNKVIEASTNSTNITLL